MVRAQVVLKETELLGIPRFGQGWEIVATLCRLVFPQLFFKILVFLPKLIT